MNFRSTLTAAGLLGATGVGLGAFGAHALRDVLLERGMSNAWETAVRYHLLHAVALLPIGVWMRQDPASTSLALSWVARTWVAGIVVFSGSLYGLALGGPRWLGPITPLGGIFFVVGWALLVVAALGRRK